MNRVDAVVVGFCETYEKLLEEREAARNQWNEQRTAIFELGLRGKEMDDESSKIGTHSVPFGELGGVAGSECHFGGGKFARGASVGRAGRRFDCG